MRALGSNSLDCGNAALLEIFLKRGNEVLAQLAPGAFRPTTRVARLSRLEQMLWALFVGCFFSHAGSFSGATYSISFGTATSISS